MIYIYIYIYIYITLSKTQRVKLHQWDAAHIQQIKARVSNHRHNLTNVANSLTSRNTLANIGAITTGFPWEYALNKLDLDYHKPEGTIYKNR